MQLCFGVLASPSAHVCFPFSVSVEIFYATAAVSRNSREDDNRRLDPVSRTVIDWPISTLCNYREIRFDLPHCAFLKLLIYQPHRHADNIDNQVSIQEIELLGVIQPINVDMYQMLLPSGDSLDRGECNAESETSMPGDCDDKELHLALLKAGVALDIVKKVMALPSDEAEPVLSEGSRHEEQHFEVAAESESSNSGHQITATESDPLHSPVVTESLGTCEQYSVFDRAVRDEIARMMDDDEIFNQVVRRNEDVKPSSKHSVLQLSSDMAFRVGLLPEIEVEDRGNLIEIIMYTFGSFFTKCLLCDSSEVRVLCIVIAERFLPILKEAMGDVVVYEGSLALLRQSPPKTSLPPASSPFDSTLGIVGQLPESYVKYGLRLIMEVILANPCCWTREHHIVTLHTQSKASTSRKKRINMDFLRFVRLLIFQETIRYSFYQVLLPVEHISSGNQIAEGGSEQSIHLVETSNRLRLFRLLLQRQKADHITIPGDIRKQIDRFCEAHSYHDTPASTAASSSSVWRLAADCLQLLHANAASRPKPINFRQLNRIHTQVDELEMVVYFMTTGPTAHEPHFVQFAISPEQQALLQDQTRRYFHLRPRPRALYQHSFSHDNLEGQSKLFQKGNIAFRGEMEERNLGDLVAFHELASAEATRSEQLTIKKIPTPFAAFKGTVEARALTAQPVSTIARRISVRMTAAHQPASLNSPSQSGSPNASAALKATAPDPIVVNPSSDSPNVLDPQKKIRSSNSTRRISSVAPGSSSHHSAAVGDMLPSQPVTSMTVPVQPLQTQHPQTAPAGGKQHSSKEADANGGCTLQ
ncbi:hypothetical protein FI667_g6568, partial [Globisporangium splendens]